MDTKIIPWSQFKTYYADIQQYHAQYSETDNSYVIWVELQGIIFETILNKSDVHDQSDITDFETNYKGFFNTVKKNIPGLANYLDKIFFCKSFKYTLAPNSINTFHEKFDKDVLFFGGIYELKGNFQDGDFFEAQLTDVDNLLGIGAGYVIFKFLETEYVFGGRDFITRIIKTVNAGILINAGFYITLKYTSFGVTPGIDVITRYDIWY